MRAFPCQLTLLALAASLLLGVGCGNREADASASEADPGRQGVEGFFDPSPGETWKYKVQREIPFQVELTRADIALRPERTESGHLITFERVRTCNGTFRPRGTLKTLTAMNIIENGVLLGQELYDIGPDGIFSKGWIGAQDSSPKEILDRGIALATATMQPGEIWDGVGRDPGRRFYFRVIERTEVEVPAGTFEATRIQITMDQGSKSLKRTIWFADNVGIVKEESVAYGPERTRVRERSELLHWVVPSASPPEDPGLATTGDPNGDLEPEDPPEEDMDMDEDQGSDGGIE